MIEIDVHIPPDSVPSAVPQLVEQICAAENLMLTLKGTLAQYPGCMHWHFKKGQERGILEITWWEKGNRLWFKVAAGRTGIWIDDTIDRVKEQFEQGLSINQ